MPERSPTCTLIIPNRRETTLEWLNVNTVSRGLERINRFIFEHTHWESVPIVLDVDQLYSDCLWTGEATLSVLAVIINCK